VTGTCIFHTVMEADTRPKIKGLSPQAPDMPKVRYIYFDRLSMKMDHDR